MVDGSSHFVLKYKTTVSTQRTVDDRFCVNAIKDFHVLRLHHLDIPLLEQCIVDVMIMAEDIAMQAQSTKSIKSVHALHYSPTYFSEGWITDGQISAMLDEAEAM